MNINIVKRSVQLALATVLLAAGLSNAQEAKTVILDYAYYNPLSLVLREKGWLEEDLKKDGITVKWVFSQGSNKSLEYLNSKSIDFASTAGVAAFISRANGNPVKSVYVASKPEWTALVVRKGSGIKSVADLKGKKVAATRGTDPFVFLVRALDQKGLTLKDVEYVALQHIDGKNALLRGDVDAWAGLDPLLAQAEVENGAVLFHRDVKLNTYDVINTREDFIRDNPRLVVRVLRAYEKARLWALKNPAAYKTLFVAEAKLAGPVADKVLDERTDISSSTIGETQKKAIAAAGEVLKKNGVIGANVDVNAVAGSLVEPRFAKEAIK